MTDISEHRKNRRETFKDQYDLIISDTLDAELVEDILVAAPKANVLQFNLLEDTSFDSTLLVKLPDIERLRIMEGSNLEEVQLKGLADMQYLSLFEINVIPEKSLDVLDLTPLAGHSEILVIRSACPAKSLRLDGLNTCPKLQSLGFYTLDLDALDLTPLSRTKELVSIYISDFGRDLDEPQTFKITPPRYTPLKVLNISEAINPQLKVEIDFAFLQDIPAMDEIAIRDCYLTTFDLENLTPLKRIGTINLTQNPLTQLDITPLLETPMYTEKALGEQPFIIDDHVIIQIAKWRKDDVTQILERPDVVVDDHNGHFAIEYEFGYQWIQYLMANHKVEWV